MDVRDVLAMHPANLPLPEATNARDSLAMHPALPSPEAVNVRDALAMHPARLPSGDRKRPRQ